MIYEGEMRVVRNEYRSEDGASVSSVMASGSIDGLVQYIVICVPRPFLLHGYVLPFILVYAAWTWVWFWSYLWTEAGVIVVCGVGGIHALTCLACRWSVHIRCVLTCRKVSRPS